MTSTNGVPARAVTIIDYPKYDWNKILSTGSSSSKGNAAYQKAKADYDAKMAKYLLAKETMLKNGYTIDSNNGGVISFSQVARRSIGADGKVTETILPRGNNTSVPAATSSAQEGQSGGGILDTVKGITQNITDAAKGIITGTPNTPKTTETASPSTDSAESGYVYKPTTSWADELAKYDKSAAEHVAKTDWSVPTTIAESVSKYSKSGFAAGISTPTYVTDPRDSGVIPRNTGLQNTDSTIDYLF